MPAWIVVLFFIPAANIALFALLCALPEYRDRPASGTGNRVRDWVGRFIPRDRSGAIVLSIVTAGLFGFLALQLGTRVLEEYGWGVFVGVPFLQGAFAALFAGYHRRAMLGDCMLAAVASVLISALLLFALAAEGAICILMATPLALILGLLGAALGYQLQRTGPAHGNAPVAMLLVLILAPLVIAASAANPQDPPLMFVSTSVDIDAPPDTVWKNVVSFPPLPEPTEAYFKAGIAITVWDEPRMLSFNVIQNPAPMAELSPYENVTTPHLHGFIEAARGEFKIVPVGRHQTRLVGTTWYTDRLWPQAYWELWSDPIIHAIHARVLEHIKALSEKSSPRSTSPSH